MNKSYAGEEHAYEDLNLGHCHDSQQPLQGSARPQLDCHLQVLNYLNI